MASSYKQTIGIEKILLIPREIYSKTSKFSDVNFNKNNLGAKEYLFAIQTAINGVKKKSSTKQLL